MRASAFAFAAREDLRVEDEFRAASGRWSAPIAPASLCAESGVFPARAAALQLRKMHRSPMHFDGTNVTLPASKGQGRLRLIARTIADVLPTRRIHRSVFFCPRKKKISSLPFVKGNHSLTGILALLNAWNKLCNIDIFKCIHKLHTLREIREDNFFLFRLNDIFQLIPKYRYRVKIILRSLFKFLDALFVTYRVDCLKIWMTFVRSRILSL